MQLVFPDDESAQPHLKLLAMAKRWKKGQDEVSKSTNEITNDNTSTTAAATAAPPVEDDDDDDDDDIPLPESRIDDEEMNDES